MYNIGGAKNEVKAGTNLSEFEAGYQGQGNLEAEDRIKNLNTEAVAVVSMEVKGCGDVGLFYDKEQKLKNKHR
ncbi:hypothetical protein BC332_18306 [Capsicum chinense]|nr:hypothetical protein BC332_18306 [Capsicum chinense]